MTAHPIEPKTKLGLQLIISISQPLPYTHLARTSYCTIIELVLAESNQKHKMECKFSAFAFSCSKEICFLREPTISRRVTKILKWYRLEPWQQELNIERTENQ